jgi:hypothetical protein
VGGAKQEEPCPAADQQENAKFPWKEEEYEEAIGGASISREFEQSMKNIGPTGNMAASGLKQRATIGDFTICTPTV